MLIGIDGSPCSLSLRNRSTLCSTTKCHQNKSDLKNVFVQKSFFFHYLFFQSQSCLLESTAAIFRQSARYVFFASPLIFWIHLWHSLSIERFFNVIYFWKSTCPNFIPIFCWFLSFLSKICLVCILFSINRKNFCALWDFYFVLLNIELIFSWW